MRRWNPDYSETTFDAAGNLIDAKVQGDVDAYVAALARWVRIIKAGTAAVDGTA